MMNWTKPCFFDLSRVRITEVRITDVLLYTNTGEDPEINEGDCIF